MTTSTPPVVAPDVLEFLALPVWSVQRLGALVDAEPRPCASEVALFDAAADAEDVDDPDPLLAVVDEALVDTARAVCAGCPVRVACAARAMVPVTGLVDGVVESAPFAPVGVFGGLTAGERLVLAGELPMAELVAAGEPVSGRVPVGLCGREGCAAPVAGPRWLYCSAGCRAREMAARARARRAAARSARPVCAREGCDEPVAGGAVRYHSAQCQRQARRARARVGVTQRREARRAAAAVARAGRVLPVCGRAGCGERVPSAGHRYHAADCAREARRESNRRSARVSRARRGAGAV